ncbi:MAG: ATP-binding protein [Anaerocolumna sp.]|jgi:ATP-binding cassette subfamily B protein|nr:ATP-binding protein [Anaerocolumna sp.]
MKNLLKFIKPYKYLSILGASAKLTEAILELFLPFLMAKVIDYGVAAGDKAYILNLGGLMLATAILGILFALACQYSASFVSQGVGTDIRNALFKHISTFSNAEIDKFGTASLINRITSDVNQVQLAVAMLIRLVIRAPFLCIGGLIMAFTIDFYLSVILILVLPVFILILTIIMRKNVPVYRIVQKKLDQIGLVIRENLSGVRVIRAFARTDYEREKFANRNQEYMDNAMRVGKLSALLNPLTNLVLNFSIGAILWFGGIRVDTGSMSTGEVIAFVGYVTQILAALIVISNLVVIYTKAFASVGRIIEVFETMPSIINVPVIKKDNTKDSEYILEFQEVSMSYEPGGAFNIEHISFRIKAGEMVGIIGGTGSGKSTIVNLIPRFYDVSQGRILVEGKDVREYELFELRKKIGVVPQKSVLFSGTIAENIRWGKADATDAEVQQAAEIAQAAEFIRLMPDGYESKIQKGGVNVSGGQRQRLTIARALVRKPSILILDDSFNALDFATDAALRKSLKESTKDMTTLIVTQRASTIRNADQIIVLSEGVIAGIGKHEELINTCQIYKEICESQEVTSSAV